MRTISVSAEFHDVVRTELQHLFEVRANLHENISATSVVSFVLADCSSPQPDSVEAFPHVDNHAHDFVIILVFESLANSSQLSMQPELIDVHRALVLELVRPFPAVLVLRVFPFRSYTLLEKMVV